MSETWPLLTDDAAVRAALQSGRPAFWYAFDGRHAAVAAAGASTAAKLLRDAAAPYTAAMIAAVQRKSGAGSTDAAKRGANIALPQCARWDVTATSASLDLAGRLGLPTQSIDGALGVVPCVMAIAAGRLLDVMPLLTTDDAGAARGFIERFLAHINPESGVSSGSAASAAGIGSSSRSGAKAGGVIQHRAPAGEDAEGSVTVDVAKVLRLGREMLSTQRPQYAEKFFARAVALVDAVLSDPAAAATLRGEGAEQELAGSRAVASAWHLLSVVCQGRAGDAEGLYRTLATSVAAAGGSGAEPDWLAPLGDVRRAMAAFELLRAMPVGWTGDAATSETRLRARLAEIHAAEKADASPTAAAEVRCQLVLTLFLMGDIERCLTEALKLQQVMRHPFGDVAIKAVCDFLGPAHPLAASCAAFGAALGRAAATSAAA
jgi:hypothetical protein